MFKLNLYRLLINMLIELDNKWLEYILWIFNLVMIVKLWKVKFKIVMYY